MLSNILFPLDVFGHLLVYTYILHGSYFWAQIVATIIPIGIFCSDVCEEINSENPDIKNVYKKFWWFAVVAAIWVLGFGIFITALAAWAISIIIKSIFSFILRLCIFLIIDKDENPEDNKTKNIILWIVSAIATLSIYYTLYLNPILQNLSAESLVK